MTAAYVAVDVLLLIIALGMAIEAHQDRRPGKKFTAMLGALVCFLLLFVILLSS